MHRVVDAKLYEKRNVSSHRASKANIEYYNYHPQQSVSCNSSISSCTQCSFMC